jgi:hypothetical protein
MLEESIAELTAAVKALTQMLNNHPAVAGTPHAIATLGLGDSPIAPVSKDNEVIKKREKKIVEEEIAEAKKPETSSESTTDTSPPSENESAPVTYDDVKKATNSLSAAKGRDATIAALAKFEVTRATQLVEAQWREYIAYAEKVIADE